jgi:hypothetical protein
VSVVRCDRTLIPCQSCWWATRAISPMISAR